MDFNNLLIGTDDPQRLADYYRKLFGEPPYEDGGYTTWQIGSGYISVGAHSEVTARARIPAGSSGTSRRGTSRPSSTG